MIMKIIVIIENVKTKSMCEAKITASAKSVARNIQQNTLEKPTDN